jgi:hypothetical protein
VQPDPATDHSPGSSGWSAAAVQPDPAPDLTSHPATVEVFDTDFSDDDFVIVSQADFDADQLEETPKMSLSKVFPDGDATPSIAGASYWRAVNSEATTITDFEDGAENDTINIALDANTDIGTSDTIDTGSSGPTSAGAFVVYVLTMVESSLVWTKQ